jgi:hypothetical protein
MFRVVVFKDVGFERIKQFGPKLAGVGVCGNCSYVEDVVN